MTLIVAMPTEHLNIVDRHLVELGEYKAPALDAASQSFKAMFQNGVLSSNQAGSDGHGWAALQTVTLPSIAACPKFWMAARFTNTPVGDGNTQMMRMNFNGAAAAAIFFTAANLGLTAANNVAPSGFLEIEIDRAPATCVVTVYYDGVIVPNGLSDQITAGVNNLLKATGTTLTVGVATKAYSGKSAGNKLSSRDAYVVLGDSVKPNTRLGAVTIESVPVVVTAVNGFDKTVSEANAILSQTLSAVAGTAPLSRPSGQMKTTGLNADITFTVASALPADRQIAVGVFVGAQRTGDKSAAMGMIRTLDGVPSANIPMLDFSIKSADRIMYSDAVQARATMAAGDARQLSDVIHKLTLAEI